MRPTARPPASALMGSMPPGLPGRAGRHAQCEEPSSRPSSRGARKRATSTNSARTRQTNARPPSATRTSRMTARGSIAARVPSAAMRALVQRVARAAVRVESAEVAAIGPGLLVLLGVTHGDGEAQADRLAHKLRALRIFPNAEGRMSEPLGDREVLCVSQFTLYGDARKGNRPTYVAAARPEHAEPLYERVCERLGARRGVFGALMEVELVNDGPVTLLLEL